MIVAGTSPVGKDASLVYKEYLKANAVFRFYYPCPSCGELDFLEWERMKSTIKAPDGTGMDSKERIESVRHVCAHCGSLNTYQETIDALEEGLWMVPPKRENMVEPYEGHYIEIDRNGIEPPKLLGPKGREVPFPRNICFEIWLAYSSWSNWEEISDEYLEADIPRKRYLPSLRTEQLRWFNTISVHLDIVTLVRLHHVFSLRTVSYTHLTLPTICSV